MSNVPLAAAVPVNVSVPPSAVVTVMVTVDPAVAVPVKEGSLGLSVEPLAGL
jgi:hypothetical protein